jgi:sRNA-binding carbon storage regulator CsrA
LTGPSLVLALVTIVDVRGGQVRAGIEAPHAFEIARSELDE